MREASCCLTTERGRKFAAVRIELTLFWLWARWLAICPRCDKTGSTRRTCTGLLSVTDGPQRYLCLDGMELDVPTGNAPVASVLQTEWFTCSIGHESWSGVWDLHPPGRLHRPECCWLHHHLVLRTAVKMDPPAGVAPASSSLRKKCIAGSATEE